MYLLFLIFYKDSLYSIFNNIYIFHIYVLFLLEMHLTLIIAILFVSEHEIKRGEKERQRIRSHKGTIKLKKF